VIRKKVCRTTVKREIVVRACVFIANAVRRFVIRKNVVGADNICTNIDRTVFKKVSMLLQQILLRQNYYITDIIMIK
jgi:hypothetical protein